MINALVFIVFIVLFVLFVKYCLLPKYTLSSDGINISILYIFRFDILFKDIERMSISSRVNFGFDSEYYRFKNNGVFFVRIGNKFFPRRLVLIGLKNKRLFKLYIITPDSPDEYLEAFTLFEIGTARGNEKVVGR